MSARKPAKNVEALIRSRSGRISMNGDAPRPTLIGRIARAVVGMPPAGASVPGVGDGRTTTNRKVKVVVQPAKPVKRHRK
jgi:hypothetical protein